MSSIESLLFLFILVGAVGFFLRNLYRLFAIICLGQGENRFDHLWSRFRGMLVYAFAQVRVVSEGFGVNHLFLFWGFMFLLLMNLEFLVAGIFPRFTFWFLGDLPYGVMLFMADIMSVVVLICVLSRHTPDFLPASPHRSHGGRVLDSGSRCRSDGGLFRLSCQ